MKYAKVAAAAAVAASTLMTVGASAPAFADAKAEGGGKHSPGVVSGNVVQFPIHVPINLCGNTVQFIGALNPAFGNHCKNL
ncbi:chaplin [Streptomyces halobius]|uniref:Chaplin n=1 Tax=Streptomyces halobius TaxID=2879846 RepID=A0ABY4MCC5_9ACTN|nr:chaplin [Streptomyces halobius]UQA93971.1 chaplin [Streptomyces halobius]